MKTNNQNNIKVWVSSVICALSIGMIGCKQEAPIPNPQPTPSATPTPKPTPDPQKEAVLEAMGPNSVILSNHYVVRKEEGSTHLCIVDPKDNSVRVLLLYIP
jgi:hypothetical protein